MASGNTAPGREKAQRVLVDQTFFQLDASTFKRFTELLD